MAVVIGNNDTDSENTNGVNVLTGATASTEQPQDDSVGQGAQGSSTFQSQQTGATQSKSTSPKASSGMFKNIQKYVQKNQPQGQKMASAATGDFNKQAAEIRKATEEKSALQTKALDANTAALEKQKDFARAQVDQAMGVIPAPKPVENGPTQADQDIEFQKLMAGNIGGVNQVQDLNIAQQRSKASALQNLAKSAQNEEGRRNLLKQTFQKQEKYNRGMSGLDQLIVSGDRTARESIIKGTKNRARVLQDMIKGSAQDSRTALGMQQEDIRNFGGDVRSLAETELKNFSGLGETISGLNTTDAEIQSMGFTEQEQRNIDKLKALDVTRENNRLAREKAIEDALNNNQRAIDKEINKWGSNSSKASKIKSSGDKFVRKMIAENDKLTAEDNRISKGDNAYIESLNRKLKDSKSTATSELMSTLDSTQPNIVKANALKRLLGENNSFNIQDLIDRYNQLPKDAKVRTSGVTGGRGLK